MGSETFWGLSATGWTAITALLTGGLLVTAILAALYAAKQVQIARDQADEVRKAQAEASRPYVVVTAEPSRATHQFFDLLIRNLGHRPAVDIAIRLDPTPIRASQDKGHELAKVKMFSEPIAMLAPGQELRTFYDSHIERHGREDLPGAHHVSLTYADSSGHRFTETSILDLNALKGTMHTEVKTVHHIGKTLAEMHKTLKSASILSRRGTVEVDASVEPYGERQERLLAERAQAREHHARLVRMLQPDAALGDPEDAGQNQQ